jgi:hypothetical protein
MRRLALALLLSGCGGELMVNELPEDEDQPPVYEPDETEDVTGDTSPHENGPCAGSSITPLCNVGDGTGVFITSNGCGFGIGVAAMNQSESLLFCGSLPFDSVPELPSDANPLPPRPDPPYDLPDLVYGG